MNLFYQMRGGKAIRDGGYEAKRNTMLPSPIGEDAVCWHAHHRRC